MTQFDAADLEENRQGRLSPRQVAELTKHSRTLRIRGMVVALAFVTFFVVAGTVPNVRSTGKAIAIIAILEALFAFGIIKLQNYVYRRNMAQITAGKVDCIVGRLEAVQRGKYAAIYYVDFAGQTFVAAADLIKPVRKQLEREPHRIYCLGGRVISFEAAI